jgi:pimeloyl-ACP methyl ester carboxylesterase
MGFSVERYLDSNGVQIRFIVEGEGTPVVFIHGYTGSAEMWMLTETMPLLVESFRAVAMDCRGHGESGKPHDPDSYGLAMVADVVQLLDLLEIGSAHIIGYSMGAEIALRLATQHSERVLSLTIGGSGWSGTRDERNYQLIADSLESSDSFGPFIRAMMPADSPGPSDEVVQSADQILTANDIDALVALARSMGDVINLSNDELSAIRIPVLGIAGEHDPERPNLEKLSGVVPDFTMKVLSGRDHGSAVMDPAFNSHIIEFLSGQQ